MPMNRMRVVTGVIPLALTLVCCAPTSQPAAKPPTEQPSTKTPDWFNAHDPRETATPEQTFAELSKQPITALDLGLYRLRREMVPELDQRLRAQGLFPPVSLDANVVERGYVWVLGNGYPSDESLEITVQTALTRTAASEQAIRNLQDLDSKIVSFVRAYLGGPCAPSDDPNRQNSTVCQPATNFYYYFERPSVNSPGPMGWLAYTRAAHNLYSLVSIKASGILVGKHTAVYVACTGPAILVEVKCTTSGD